VAEFIKPDKSKMANKGDQPQSGKYLLACVLALSERSGVPLYEAINDKTVQTLYNQARNFSVE